MTLNGKNGTVQRWASAGAGAWLLYAVALFTVLTLIRVLAYWAIAFYGLLGAHMDNLHPTLASTLSDALYIYPLDLEVRGFFVVPVLLILLPLAKRLRRRTFVVTSCILMAVATAPTLVFEYAPLSFHVFSFAVAVAVGLLLPSRDAARRS